MHLARVAQSANLRMLTMIGARVRSPVDSRPRVPKIRPFAFLHPHMVCCMHSQITHEYGHIFGEGRPGTCTHGQAAHARADITSPT